MSSTPSGTASGSGEALSTTIVSSVVVRAAAGRDARQASSRRPSPPATIETVTSGTARGYRRVCDTGHRAACLFGRIVAGELPSARILEDDRVIAIMDIFPATRGHALVIPRAHAADIRAVEADDLAAVAATAQRLAGRAYERLGA